MPKFLDSVEREWRIEEERQQELDDLHARIAELEAELAKKKESITITIDATMVREVFIRAYKD